jgi:hypothetical protein
LRLKIISDGTIAGTSIVDLDSEQPLRNVRAVEWGFDATALIEAQGDEPGPEPRAWAKVLFVNVPVEIIAATDDAPDRETLLQIIGMLAQGVALADAVKLPRFARVRAALDLLTQPPPKT